MFALELVDKYDPYSTKSLKYPQARLEPILTPNKSMKLTEGGTFLKNVSSSLNYDKLSRSHYSFGLFSHG